MPSASGGGIQLVDAGGFRDNAVLTATLAGLTDEKQRFQGEWGRLQPELTQATWKAEPSAPPAGSARPTSTSMRSALGFRRGAPAWLATATFAVRPRRPRRRLGRSAGAGPLRCGASGPRPPRLSRTSELEELVEGSEELDLLRPEVDQDGPAVVDFQDAAESILVVRHTVVRREGLGRRSGGRRLERAGGQVTPSTGFSGLHLCSMRSSKPCAGPVQRVICKSSQ